MRKRDGIKRVVNRPRTSRQQIWVERYTKGEAEASDKQRRPSPPENGEHDSRRLGREKNLSKVVLTLERKRTGADRNEPVVTQNNSPYQTVLQKEKEKKGKAGGGGASYRGQ